MPEVTYLVNVTPKDPMMVQAHLLAKSIEVNSQTDYQLCFVWDHGFEYADVIGKYPWLKRYPHQVHTTPEEYNRRLGYVGNFLYRFEVPVDTESVVIADADTIVLRSLENITRFAVDEQALLGVAAGTFLNELAEKCFAALGCKRPQYTVEFMPWGTWGHDEERRYTPPHFNCGFVYMTSDIKDRIGRSIYQNTLACKKATRHGLHTQLGVMMSILEEGIKYHDIHLRFNMTAHGPPPLPERRESPEERVRTSRVASAIRDPVVVHYCVSNNRLSKREDFSTYEAVGRILERDPGSDQMVVHIQDFLREHLPDILREARG